DVPRQPLFLRGRVEEEQLEPRVEQGGALTGLAPVPYCANAPGRERSRHRLPVLFCLVPLHTDDAVEQAVQLLLRAGTGLLRRGHRVRQERLDAPEELLERLRERPSVDLAVRYAGLDVPPLPRALAGEVPRDDTACNGPLLLVTPAA